MTVPGEMSPGHCEKCLAWGAYFNASGGVATNGAGYFAENVGNF
jgi:hypothetical protein